MKCASASCNFEPECRDRDVQALSVAYVSGTQVGQAGTTCVRGSPGTSENSFSELLHEDSRSLGWGRMASCGFEMNGLMRKSGVSTNFDAGVQESQDVHCTREDPSGRL